MKPVNLTAESVVDIVPNQYLRARTPSIFNSISFFKNYSFAFVMLRELERLKEREDAGVGGSGGCEKGERDIGRDKGKV